MALKEGIRPVWAEIDLNHLRYNLLTIRKRLAPQTKIMAVVKSDGYGHGAIEVSRHVLEQGADALAVVLVDEGIELRKAGIRAPILILGATPQTQLEQIVEYDLTPMVCSLDIAQQLNSLGEKKKQQINIHVRVDIGLGSIGIRPDECLAFLYQLLGLPWLQVEGLFTHLASAYGGEEAKVQQDLQQFQDLVAELEDSGFTIPLIHAASSPAIISLPAAQFQMVRAGILLYGLPALEQQDDFPLYPVMQLKARVTFVKELGAGSTIGYGSQHTIARQTRIATVPLGYGDGFFLFFLKEGEVLVKGRRVPIFGNVFMDHFIIDVTDFPEVEVGDEVVIFGQQGQEVITAQEVAIRSQIGGMNCDCITLLSKRVPRVYVYEESIQPVPSAEYTYEIAEV